MLFYAQPAKNNHWGTGIVMSYTLIVLARTNWRKVEIHKWITTVNIDFSPPRNQGVACKNKI